MIAATLSRILPATVALSLSAASAATIGPPMLDINRQCDAQSRRNATAMSECVVAESEARSELLQNWAKYPDDDAEKCIKFGRRAKRLPYSAMARCLAADAPAAPVPAAHKP